MAEENLEISRLMHEYRKALSRLKIKSFYANHLCKVDCLDHKLNVNPAECFQKCDSWLKDFYTIKKNNNPLEAQDMIMDIESKYGRVSGEEANQCG